MTTKAAVIIGIEDYEHLTPLTLCCEDAQRMGQRLATHDDGSPNFHCKVATSPRQRIDLFTLREYLDRLLCSNADEALLYFAGHGGVDEQGGYLAARDTQGGATALRMAEILERINASPIPRITVMLDCCSASAMGELLGAEGQAVVRQGVSMLTACHPAEIARVAGQGGVFTTALCDALDGGAADVRGQVTVASTYAYLDESFGVFDQRPELKAHLARLTVLRRCPPAVGDAVLRRLPEWFSDATAVLPLSPAFEPTADPRDPEREAVFGQLQQCRAAKLVEPVGFEHMYDAAMQGGHCRLTALGRHYHEMATRGLL